MSAGVPDVLNFLAESHKKGKSNATVNVARSMLSSTLPTNSTGTIGKDPLVTSLLKGVYNERPPVPRYLATWNPDTVLAYFDATAATELSLLQLSRKTVTLVALCSLLRTCEISSILLDSIHISDSKVSFTLGKPRKAQHSGPLQQISIDSWPQNVSICPVSAIELYLERTQSLRNLSNSTSLFLSSNKPNKVASVSTIGHWIKEQLKEAGIDTSTFSAHSTRGAAASKAAASGISIQTILDQGQ